MCRISDVNKNNKTSSFKASLRHGSFSGLIRSRGGPAGSTSEMLVTLLPQWSNEQELMENGHILC